MKAIWMSIVAFVLIVNCFVSMWHMKALEVRRNWEHHSREVLDRINLAKLQMSDIEGCAFLVNASNKGVETPQYTHAVLSLQETLRDLETDVKGSADQVKRVRHIRGYVLEHLFLKGHDGKLWIVKRLSESNRSDVIHFRQLIDEIETAEKSIFVHRFRDMSDVLGRIVGAVIVATAIGISVLILFYVGHRWNAKSRSNDQRSIVENSETLAATDHQRKLLADLGQKALEGMSCSELMTVASHQLSDVLRVEYTKFLELQPDRGHLKLVAGTGWREGLVGHAVLGTEMSSQAGYTLAASAPVIVDDLRTELRFNGPSILHEHGVISGMSVIIHGKTKPWGVLSVHTNHRRKFTEEHIHFLQNVANIIAQAHQRHENEEELIRSKEMAEAASKAKDQFLAVLSHEMRTPLTPCLLTASSMAIQPSISEEARNAFLNIQKNLELEARLIDDLLDVMLITKGKMSFHMTVIDAHHKIDLAIGICRPDLVDKQITLKVDLSADQRYITVDSARFQQVIWNIVKNSVKFTPAFGTISIRTYNRGEFLIVEIEDTGIGIKADLVPTIFEAFEQGERSKSRKYGGLGLGLTISRSIVEGHKGNIRVFSEGEGKGAKFVVEFQTTFVPSLPAIEFPEETPGSEICKVFYVEDDDATRRVMVKLMESVGFEVLDRRSLQEALEVDPSQWDILVSDIGLGDGTGVELMNQIRERGFDIPGVALSGYGTEEDMNQSIEAGFSEHLTKPISFPLLEAAIRRVAKRK